MSAPSRMLLLAAATLSAGCMGTPSPLVPTLAGSVGYPHHGVQTAARALPPAGPGYALLRSGSQVNWGRPRLVEAIRLAARQVAEEMPGGAPLLVGDLSAKYGGEVPRHRSHRSGRDVDLLWYVTTPLGVPIRNPGFVHVAADLLAATDEGYVRLDIERQWLLVKSLISSPLIEVQWIFCSRAIEALLIDYARARETDFALLWRAETLLMQPGDSLAHDDHLHVRVACSAEETVGGCLGGGPAWNWLPQPPTLGGPLTPMLERLAAEDPGPSTTHAERERAGVPEAGPSAGLSVEPSPALTASALSPAKDPGDLP